ncbi:hypothetical protein [Spiroplasma floricola]|uniref:ABC transporter permease n=1 Tax=Spiroplasma floricola 23-6 TaxID=1336749 RepID=A0A2K8SE16_9MOLU|nr:hypothetical protein [Spiroplasma floricola]AUB31706.1 hypothetical protein SFLOR_v1c06560 [Spiroplasma floricola 23-6]
MLTTNKKLASTISFKNILIFNFKMIFREKSFIILNLFLLTFPIIYSLTFLFLDTGEKIVTYFNFYIIIYISLFIFLIILRSLQFFLVNIIDNKLLYLVLSNQISRLKMLCGQFILILGIAFINILFSCIVIIAASTFMSDNFKLVLRLNLAFLAYSFMSCLFLISFILLLLLVTSLQVTTIICTLLISITFLSNIPRQFITTKEEQSTIKFNYNGGQLYKIPDLYDSFDLQDYIVNYKVKYPYLSFALNKFMVEDNQFTKESFVTNESISNRLNNFWTSLGVINNTEMLILKDNLNLKTLPVDAALTDLAAFKPNDSVDFKIYLNKTFIDEVALKELAYNSQDKSQSEKLVLQDLYNFLKTIQNQLSNFKELSSDYFNEFVFVDESKSKIYKDNKTISATMRKDYLVNLYKYNLNATSSLQNGLTLKPGVNENKFVKEDLFLPLMLAARILEEYFINYTSKYIVATNYQVDVNNEGWINYLKAREKFDWYNNVNIFNGIWTNYANFSGFSYDDFWFKNYSKSKIELNEQKNLFLSYKNYTFKLNEQNIINKNSSKNYIQAWIYLAIQSCLSLIFILIGSYKFSRADLR